MAAVGATVVMCGVVLLVIGASGLLGSGGASFSRLRTARPIVFYSQVVAGVLLVAVGAALVAG